MAELTTRIKDVAVIDAERLEELVAKEEKLTAIENHIFDKATLLEMCGEKSLMFNINGDVIKSVFRYGYEAKMRQLEREAEKKKAEAIKDIEKEQGNE